MVGKGEGGQGEDGTFGRRSLISREAPKHTGGFISVQILYNYRFENSKYTGRPYLNDNSWHILKGRFQIHRWIYAQRTFKIHRWPYSGG